jgi:hypothetical protein
MECYIEQKHMDKPLRKYPDISLYLGGNQWPSIQGALDDFCISRSIRRLTISSHQVVLRSILDGLPLLSNKNGHNQGEWMLSTLDYFNVFLPFLSKPSVRYHRMFIQKTYRFGIERNK